MHLYDLPESTQQTVRKALFDQLESDRLPWLMEIENITTRQWNRSPGKGKETMEFTKKLNTNIIPSRDWVYLYMIAPEEIPEAFLKALGLPENTQMALYAEDNSMPYYLCTVEKWYPKHLVQESNEEEHVWLLDAYPGYLVARAIKQENEAGWLFFRSVMEADFFFVGVRFYIDCLKGNLHTS